MAKSRKKKSASPVGLFARDNPYFIPKNVNYAMSKPTGQKTPVIKPGWIE